MSAKCDRCGVTTDTPEIFKRRRRFFRRRVGSLCPLCWRKSKLFTLKATLWFSLIEGLLGLILVIWEPRLHGGWMLLNLLLFQLFLILAILPHELGHAFAARLVGL